MNKIKLNLTFLIVGLLFQCTTIAFSQQTTPKTISAGVVNGKAKTLPVPEYPAEAKAVKAAGAVNVQVTIDENGNVISAAATSGHSLLRASAVEAARQAKFSPTLLSGKPVKVTGVIVYNFVPNETVVAPGENTGKASYIADTMKPIALGMMLNMLRSIKTRVNPMHSDAELKSILSEAAVDFPDLKQELIPLTTITELPLEQQNRIAGEIISSVKTKLRGMDIWRFDLGINFGEAIAIMFNALNEQGDFEINKFDKSVFKINLLKLKDAIYSAQAGLPAELRQSFNDFAEKIDEQKLQSDQELADAMERLGQFFERLPKLDALK